MTRKTFSSDHRIAYQLDQQPEQQSRETSHSHGGAYILKLADGTAVSLIGEDDAASGIVARLADAMQLQPCQFTPAHRLIIVSACPAGNGEAGKGPAKIVRAGPFVGPIPSPVAVPSWLVTSTNSSSANQDPIYCLVYPAQEDHLLVTQMVHIAENITRKVETGGGLYLHGALAERDGYGVILAGPGGAGKTTASRRFPSPWRSLSDDGTLVVRDRQGTYWAHPWPTWSRFMFGFSDDGSPRTWDVQHAVPLRGVFFLVQAQEEQIDCVSESQAVCLLTRATRIPALDLMMGQLGADEVRTHCLLTFNNVCELAGTIPVYILSLSLHGSFWREIESVIVGDTPL